MSNELLLLGLLSRHEMHGYQLNEFLSKNLASCTDLKKSSAYFLLGKMAQQGWVAEESVQEGNRPPRRVFHITDAGADVFQQLLRQNLATYTPVTFAGDVGLAFLDALPTEEAVGLLKERREAVSLALHSAQSAPHHPGSLGLVLEHQARHLQAEIAWLDQVLEDLDQAAKS